MLRFSADKKGVIHDGLAEIVADEIDVAIAATPEAGE
jgi:hypothetical protein